MFTDCICPATVPADCDPASGLALPALPPELSRRRGAACAAWARPLLREHPQLGSEIRPDDRATAAATPSSAERSLAPRRDGGADRRQTDVPLARDRSRRRDPRRAASANSTVTEEPVGAAAARRPRPERCT